LVVEDRVERIKHSRGTTQYTSVVLHQHVTANHNKVHQSTRIIISDKWNAMTLNSLNRAARNLDTDYSD
jgi:hypothetical protein